MSETRAVPIGDELFTGSDTISVHSPFNGAELGRVPSCGPEEVRRAVAAAKARRRFRLGGGPRSSMRQRSG